MNTKRTFEVINRMVADGVIEGYAIGGAVGAVFYIEPSDTGDVDVFVTFPQPAGLIVSLAPIYAYLAKLGYSQVVKEGVLVEGWPVQFLPADSPLGAESLASAVVFDVDGVPVRVMTAEHLVAHALNVGRGKDFLRILTFLDSGKLDAARLEDILKRHNLVEKWRTFEDGYVKGRPMT